MSERSKKIGSAILFWVPGVLMSSAAIAKFMGSKLIVANLTRVGFLPHFPLPALATLDLLCVVLLLIPKSFRLGLLMVTAYLGGAIAVEISEGVPPLAGVLLLLIWAGAYIKDKTIFQLSSAA